MNAFLLVAVTWLAAASTSEAGGGKSSYPLEWKDGGLRATLEEGQNRSELVLEISYKNSFDHAVCIPSYFRTFPKLGLPFFELKDRHGDVPARRGLPYLDDLMADFSIVPPGGEFRSVSNVSRMFKLRSRDFVLTFSFLAYDCGIFDQGSIYGKSKLIGANKKIVPIDASQIIELDVEIPQRSLQ